MAAIATPYNIPEAPTSKASLWTGRILSALMVLFLLFDSIAKIIREPHVIQASAEFGFNAAQIVLIGIILLGCTLLYAIPRTAVLGAMLLTGYLGGAVVSQLRVGHGMFECIFPIIFATLAWAGLFLREPRLRALTPVRK